MQNTVYSPVEYTVFQAKVSEFVGERRLVSLRDSVNPPERGDFRVI